MSQDDKKPQRIKSFKELANWGEKKRPEGRDVPNLKKPGQGKAYHPGQGQNNERRQSHPGKDRGKGGGKKTPPSKDHHKAVIEKRGPEGRGMQIFPLPIEVTDNLEWSKCENFSLLFYRFIPYAPDWTIDKDRVWEKIEKRSNELAKSQDLKYFLDREAGLPPFLKKLYGEENVREIVGKTIWRLAIGLGNTGPLETGMTLHRLYGIPYLPATAIKGVCRSWKFSTIGDLGNPANQEEYDTFLEVFGDQNGKGKVQLYDAYPVIDNPGQKYFEKDIINVHYQPFYQDPEKNQPADYFSPVPNYFLTVAAGVRFRFLLTLKRNENAALLKKAADWLKQALSEFGIGAKTSVGYGEIGEFKVLKE